MKSHGTSRTVAVATALVAALCLAGCSEDSDDARAASGESSPVPESPAPESTVPESTVPGSTVPESAEQGSAETSGSALLGICDYISTDDVVDSFGVEIEEDAAGGGGADEQGVTWKYDTCSWETPEEIEVTLAVATSEGFPDGVLACPPLAFVGTPGDPVAGLDGDAWWVASGFDGQEGSLRVCTDTHLVDIDVDRPSGTVALDVLREQASDLATKVLLRLET